MNKKIALLSSIVLAITALVSAPASAQANAQAEASDATSTSYYWLHPKLGYVKVDRATNTMLRPVQASHESIDANAPAAPRKYWLDPKGNMRVLNPVNPVKPTTGNDGPTETRR